MKSVNEVKIIEMENLILDLAEIVKENRQLREENEQLRSKKSRATEDIMQEHIVFLDLPTRIFNALLRNNIDTIEKLCKLTYLNAYKLRGMGHCSLKKLLKIMDMYDLHFTEEDNFKRCNLEEWIRM